MVSSASRRERFRGTLTADHPNAGPTYHPRPYARARRRRGARYDRRSSSIHKTSSWSPPQRRVPLCCPRGRARTRRIRFHEAGTRPDQTGGHADAAETAEVGNRVRCMELVKGARRETARGGFFAAPGGIREGVTAGGVVTRAGHVRQTRFFHAVDPRWAMSSAERWRWGEWLHVARRGEGRRGLQCLAHSDEEDGACAHCRRVLGAAGGSANGPKA